MFALGAMAGDTVYVYDALGRLKQVTRPDGSLTTYTLDAAGNRTAVGESAGTPGAPATISAPPTNTTGSFTVSWTPPEIGAATSYQLFVS